jgi:GT2 family glycosyltransferase
VSGGKPSVSVVIPAYHSDEWIQGCLQALGRQTFRDFEVIVVNSSPGDDTAAIARGSDRTYVESPERLLPHAARNRGVEEAGGDLIVFTDPDCCPRPDWLERLLAAHRAGHPVVVGSMGLADPAADTRACGVHLCKFSWLLEGLEPGPRWIGPTANVAYARDVWRAVGPFNGSMFAGDALLSWRAAAAGATPWFEPGARVDHHHGENARDLWRQRLRRGREFGAVRARHEDWSRGHAAGRAVLGPCLAAVPLVRAGRDSWRAGWGRSFVATLPMQAVGQIAWSLGEAQAHARHAFRRRTR